jgi:hypothetical protein
MCPAHVSAARGALPISPSVAAACLHSSGGLSFAGEAINTKNCIYVMGAVIAAALVGCVSTSNVTPTGGGTYVVQGRAIGPWNADKERAKALKKATGYCAKQGKRVLLHDMDETGHAALLGEHATITFECET